MKNEAPPRGLTIAVANTAPDQIKSAAAKIGAAVDAHSLLKVFAGGRAPQISDTRALLDAKPEQRGFVHLVVVGLPDDPLVQAAWGREARRAANGDFFVFGFGHLRGDIGTIESDRNPFLHSRFIKKAPYETEIVLISGNTAVGVALAAEAFLKGLVNGVVAAPGWTRPQSALLERDPLPGDFALPDWLPEKLGEWTKIGVTQGAEDEYRGVLADAGALPQAIWRVKYWKPGVWDGAGEEHAMEHYFAGLQRRAYANTLWLARFSSEAEAKTAAPKIAAAAQLKKVGESWSGAQPPYGYDAPPTAPLILWQRGVWLLISTVPGVDGIR